MTRGHLKDQGIETSSPLKRTSRGTSQYKQMRPKHGKIGHKANSKRRGAGKS